MRTRTNLDALRAFAVITVLIDHASIFAGAPMFHGWDLRWLGVFGVYLFFLHTCLVLMWSLERRPNTLDFYTRRVFRIYPLAILTILIIVGFHISSMYNNLPLSKGLVLSNLLLIQNLWPHPNVLGVLWSLPLEVQMYLLLPVFFAFARRERSIWTMLLLWFSACVLDLATYGHHAGNVGLMVVPHFLPGVIAYIAFRKQEARLPPWSLTLLIACLLIFFMHWPRPETGWIVCLVLGLTLPSFRDTQAKLVKVTSHHVATYSYGIYLLHPLCLLLGFSVFAGHSLWMKLAASLFFVSVCSVAAYHLVEKPLVRFGGRFAEHLTHRFAPKMTERDLALEVAP